MNSNSAITAMFINTSMDDVDRCDFSRWDTKPSQMFPKLTAVPMILIIITSLAGNILICYAFVRTPRLRVVTNYFLMNLAVSDILTASFVIPFDADMILNGTDVLQYGVAMCKIWTTAYTISVPCSFLTLCVVSIDRYLAISTPLRYRAGITLNKTKAVGLIAGVWGLSLLAAFLPSIVGSPLNSKQSHDCHCHFDMSHGYSAAVTIVAFFLPSVVMAIIYVKAYIIIAHRRNILNEIGNNDLRSNNPGDHNPGNNHGHINLDNIELRSRNPGGNKTGNTTPRSQSSESDRLGSTSLGSHNPRNDSPRSNNPRSKNSTRDSPGSRSLGSHNPRNDSPGSNNPRSKNSERDSPGSRSLGSNSPRNDQPRSDETGNNNRSSKSESKRKRDETHGHHMSLKVPKKRTPLHEAQQAKIARHFAIVVFIQLICWYPHSIASIVFNLCNNCPTIDNTVFNFLLAIGYLSCAINPYLYAYQQRSFRQAFKKMLGISA